MTPNGWRHARLRDLAAYIGRGTTPKYAAIDTGVYAVNQKCVRDGRVTVQYCRAHESDAPVKNESRLEPGDICVNSTGTGTAGRVGLWSGGNDGASYFIDTHVTVVRALRQAIDPKFLVEVLLSSPFQKVLETDCFSGSTNQIELNKSAFSDLELLVPSLPEQWKIAAILSAVDDAIEGTQAVIDQIQVVKKAMMVELLTRGLPGRHARFKQTEVGILPEAWDVLLFEQILAEGDSLSYGIVQPGELATEGVPMLRTVDLDDQGGRSATVVLQVSRQIENAYERTRLRGGEVLLSVMGTVGRTAVVPPEWRNWNVNRALAVIRPNPRVTARFLSFWLRTPSTQDRFAVEKIGSAQKRVNLKDLRQMRVPVPTIDEQNSICDVLASIEHRHTCEVQKLSGLHHSKTALMSVLLNGELRVTPDEAAP